MKLAAEFYGSAMKSEDCPKWRRAEIALAGRSNVGKSSMLNALAGRKNLARTSKTPGRTRTLNFFIMDENAALVDLPGFGYAKLPQVEAIRIARLIENYLAQRPNLRSLVLLIDARRGPQEEELALASMAKAQGLGFIAIATKSDKLRRSERAEAVQKFQQYGLEPLMCSSLTGEGLDHLRKWIRDAVSAEPDSLRTP
jgi:GTP-binding protein